MATFDQLSAEQRAILELVLQRGQSYSALADMLSMQEERVRELAHDAMVHLAPVTAPKVEDDWRGQIADYILGQQSGPESTATRGHLRRSEQARAWAGSLLDSLETLYGDRAMPTIPAGARERERRRRGAAPPVPAEELSPEAQEALRQRRRLTLAAGLAAALALVVLVWPVGVLTGDDDDGDGGGDGTAAADGEQAQGQQSGIAVVANQGRRTTLVVQAVLEPSQRGEAYEVWLYNSPEDARSLGAQVTNAQGQYQGAGPLPEDYERYEFVDISREPINDDGSHSGESVLRGQIGRVDAPPEDAPAGRTSILARINLAAPSD
jgi:hypothetical protein